MTEGYAVNWTVTQPRTAPQVVADRLETLLLAIDIALSALAQQSFGRPLEAGPSSLPTAGGGTRYVHKRTHLRRSPRVASRECSFLDTVISIDGGRAEGAGIDRSLHS